MARRRWKRVYNRKSTKNVKKGTFSGHARVGRDNVNISLNVETASNVSEEYGKKNDMSIEDRIAKLELQIIDLKNSMVYKLLEKEYIGAPVLGPIVFCLSTMAMGIILDYVYEKTETIWMPSLMHGSINAIATLFPFMVKPEYSNLSILGPAFIGIISMVPMLALAVIICLKQSKKQA